MIYSNLRENYLYRLFDFFFFFFFFFFFYFIFHVIKSLLFIDSNVEHYGNMDV